MTYKRYLLIFSMVCSVAAQAQLQKINTIAGNGFGGFGGDGADASGASLWGPIDVALDAAGNMYISDQLNYRIRKVNIAGVITTIAGNGISGNTGNGSIGTSAEITPRGVAVNNNGNIYISDAASHVVRKVNGLGIISAVAGTGHAGYNGDNIQATAAKLDAPSGITFDSKGNLYIADMGNNVVRKVDTAGKISTVAGIFTSSFSGDGGPATNAALNAPYSVAVDHYGNIYIADYGNDVVRMVDATTKMISTFAGTVGTYSYSGDSGLANAATLNGPRGVAVDTAGNVYISDANNSVIRKVVRSSGIIYTVAGNGSAGFGGDLGYAKGANLFNPYGLTVDANGSIYIADANNERIRKTYNISVGVNTVATGKGIVVYPNPAGDNVYISGLALGDHVCIRDMAGRQVGEVWQASGAELQTYDIKTLAPGSYLLYIADAARNGKMVSRLVKQ